MSKNLIVQFGAVTEHLNRDWYEKNTGQVVTKVQRQVFHPIKRWMAATLDGMVEGTGSVFEAKFMLPWNFSEEGAAAKHMTQLQHNMWVTAARTAVLSIITGGGKWVEMTISGGSAVPASFAHGGEEILALRREWRAPSPVGGRAAATSDRSRPRGGHERLELLGGICRALPQHPASFCGARARQG
jgi:hypothetical protein